MRKQGLSMSWWPVLLGFVLWFSLSVLNPVWADRYYAHVCSTSTSGTDTGVSITEQCAQGLSPDQFAQYAVGPSCLYNTRKEYANGDISFYACAYGEPWANYDVDQDGLLNGVDSDPYNTNESDSDGDGVPDSSDACPGHDDTIDVDNDGTPDGCDSLIDSDGDGVADTADICPGHDDNIDTDGDGTPDGCDSTNNDPNECLDQAN